MYERDLAMLKSSIISISLLLSLSACSTFSTQKSYEKPEKLLFTNQEKDTLPLQIQRDERLCNGDKIDDQKCPIKFFIDDFKAGEFYINNATTYYLKPNEYELTVKNCNEKCSTYHTKINIDQQLPTLNLILSVDENGKPFIINKKS